MANCELYVAAKFVVINLAVLYITSGVDRAKITHGRFVLRRYLDDLGAEIREMNDVFGPGGLIRFAIAGVLKGHPAVAGLRHGAHHLGVKIAGIDLPHVEALFLGFEVGSLEFLAIQVREMRHDLWIKQRPLAVGLDALHEKIRDPVGEI